MCPLSDLFHSCKLQNPAETVHTPLPKIHFRETYCEPFHRFLPRDSFFAPYSDSKYCCSTVSLLIFSERKSLCFSLITSYAVCLSLLQKKQTPRRESAVLILPPTCLCCDEQAKKIFNIQFVGGINSIKIISFLCSLGNTSVCCFARQINTLCL